MNTSSSTLIEQLEDERSLTDSLINELLLLRQKLNITQYKDDTFDSDMIPEISKKLDALEMRVLRIKKKSIPRDWNLYKVIWRLDQFSDIFQNAEKYEKSLSHVRAPYCDPNSLKDVCSPIFFSQPFGYTFHLRAYPYGIDTAKGKYMSVCLAMCPGPYDEILTWPFQGVIEIHLLGQGNIYKPYKQLIVTNNNNSECFKKPIPTASNTAITILCFIPHDELMNPEKPWLKNNSIFFEVKVINTLYAPLST